MCGTKVDAFSSDLLAITIYVKMTCSNTKQVVNTWKTRPTSAKAVPSLGSGHV